MIETLNKRLDSEERADNAIGEMQAQTSGVIGMTVYLAVKIQHELDQERPDCESVKSDVETFNRLLEHFRFDPADDSFRKL